MFLLEAGGTVIDFGSIAFIRQAEAIAAATRPLLTGGFEPWWARRSTRAYSERGAPRYNVLVQLNYVLAPRIRLLYRL
jgi:hypothetical protein